MTRIAITGITGLLGGTLLAELLSRHARALDSLEIIALGRSRPEATLRQRVEAYLLGHAAQYLAAAGISPDDVRAFCRDRLACLELDFSASRALARPADFAEVAYRPVDHVIHTAAHLDFGAGEATRAALDQTNVAGTRRVLELVDALPGHPVFHYVGTAYACGRVTTSEPIPPDFFNPAESYRNPYEDSKARTERLVRSHARRTGLTCRIYRPSTLSGWLLEPPAGATSNFNVFYEWARWLLRFKEAQLAPGEDRYATPVALDLRIACHPASGLDITPVDYAAMLLAQVCLSGSSAESYHLTNPHGETPHRSYVAQTLAALNISGAQLVDTIPEPRDQNRLEQAYYRTAGRIFTPYVIDSPMTFDTSSADAVAAEAGVRCPAVDAARFQTLIAYAKEHHFGLPPSRTHSSAHTTPATPATPAMAAV